MNVLSDTHALIWYLSGDRSLPPGPRGLFDDDANEVYVSAASAWEITTKHRLGKLPEVNPFADDVQAMIVKHGFIPLPVTMAHAELAGRMAGAHRDPFDRMLIAQALLENLTLVSNETRFDAFGVRRLW